MRLINVDMTDSEISSKVQEISANADVYLAVRKVLASFPTVEAEPIKHGKWNECIILGNSRYKCSVCGGVRRLRTLYCPFCGAKMDRRDKK